ncbi:hydrolase 1, exosortase A system-associated [Erythrobacter aurantius]|uniref:hydrolase 1, exosortase A system-associated n=1 Tax=Erythrobacter aurantius TaxID=2909249 RepID=UPI00207A891D|nr:hydrolase 1, exosortase A system-associated [Erythrobacter aurantius]
MSRLHFDFGCGSLKLAGSLDTAPGSTGLLIVSGGNELRSGAFSGQSRLAARIAKAGFPVFRFDRRGIGDSEGENRGFRHSAKDIRAALDAFRALAPQVDRVIGFGNCDAASALILMGGEGFDGLVLSNPWTIDEDEGDTDEPQHTPEAIRSRYLEKLKNPAEIARLLRGGVNLRKLAAGLLGAAKSAPQASQLLQEMRAGIADFSGSVTYLVATDDRTGQLFESAWGKDDPRIQRCLGAGHAYVEPAHQDWLKDRILEVIRA